MGLHQMGQRGQAGLPPSLWWRTAGCVCASELDQPAVEGDMEEPMEPGGDAMGPAGR